MAAADVDTYLAGVPEPGRGTLEDLRRTILLVVPDAEQTLSYGVPAFTVGGKAVAGFAAASRHLSYLPHSGSVLTTVSTALDGYDASKGALRFPPDRPLPADLVTLLVTTRLRELGLTD